VLDDLVGDMRHIRNSLVLTEESLGEPASSFYDKIGRNVGFCARQPSSIVFPSEVETGSREGNASQ
jgi:hypothetical protein